MVVNNQFFVGFEGESSVDLKLLQFGEEKKRMIIWEGYFEIIMDCLITCLKQNDIRKGLIKGDWYEKSSWLIEDLDFEINQLKNFSCDNLEDEDKEKLSKILLKLPEIVNEIISLLVEARDANYDVYISSDY